MPLMVLIAPAALLLHSSASSSACAMQLNSSTALLPSIESGNSLSKGLWCLNCYIMLLQAPTVSSTDTSLISELFKVGASRSSR